MLHTYFEDLLIHGEGGDGGAGAAPGAAPGPEAAGVTTPDAGEMTQQLPPHKSRKRGQQRLDVEYGQPKAEQQPAAQAQQPQKQPWEEVKKLYKDEYGKDVQTAIQGRFRNQADNEAALNSTKAELEEARSMLAQLAKEAYNIQPGEDGAPDMEAIRKLNGRNRIEEYALENGVSDEYAEKALAMQDKLDEQDRQIREFQKAEEARRKDAESYAQFQQHRQQAEAFRQKMNWPEFDLVKEMENSPTFAQLLSVGVGVENAYFTAHHDELMAAQAQAASMQATRALASKIQTGQSRPVEGGLGRSPAASPQRVIDPRKLTPEQRRDVRRRIHQGENIVW